MSERRLPLLLTALWVAEMTQSFETSMILSALKVLVAQFGDPSRVGWLVTGYLLVGAAAAAIVGRLGDLYGRRRVMLLALAIGAVGSLISAFADTFGTLLAGRILQGATNTILPLCLGIVRERAPAGRIPLAVGLMMSGATIGTALGLVLGGAIVDHFSWHGIFFASAAFCIVSALMVWRFVPPSPGVHMRDRVDWVSGILFAPGVTLVLLYLTAGRSLGWLSALALLSLAGGAVLCGLWWRSSIRSANPLIDVRLLADRSIAVSCAATAFIAMGTLQITVFFTLLLQAPAWTVAGLGLSATAAGLVKLPSNLTSILGAPLGGWLTGRGGGRLAMAAGGLITVAGWTLVLIDAGSVGVIVAELIVISFGTTMLFAVAPTIIAEAAPPERTSEATGMLGVIRALFMGIGSQVVTTLLAADSVRRGGETYPSPVAYQQTLIAIIALTAAATMISLFLPGERLREAVARADA